MALGFFCLAVFLYLSLDPDSGYTAASAAASGKEGVEITYGSAIEKTKFRLHSHDVPYGSGSGQQSVTGFPGVVDSNSYWLCYLHRDVEALFVSHNANDLYVSFSKSKFNLASYPKKPPRLTSCVVNVGFQDITEVIQNKEMDKIEATHLERILPQLLLDF